MAIAITRDQEQAAHWKTQIELCDRVTNKWRKRAERICENYRDERSQQDAGVAKRLNLFWSNVQTLKPVIYSRTPVPICERRFLDKDPIARVAACILERALRYEVSMSDFDCSVRRCRDDYLIPGRGQVWVRYDPKFGDSISPKQTADSDISLDGSEEKNEDKTEEKSEEKADAEEREFLAESLAVDYVHWKDFYIFPPNARTWPEVEGVGRRLFMSRDDMKAAEFKAWDKITLDHVPKMDDGSQGGGTLVSREGTQATVYEIWWRPERKIYFVAKAHDKLCKEADDPLKLEDFFPCPEPLSATMTNDTMIPVPDYAESQDQYIQIDELSKRIDILTSSTKVVGVYDSAAQSLKRVFEEAEEPNLIPVDSWAMFAEKGGLKGAIDWVPIDMVAKTLQILIEVRAKIIEDLDRMTGISDIMRGTTDARETMGAQRLKTNNSATRVNERQDEMARFCRDIICIMGEIVAEHYSPETLIQFSGALYDESFDEPPKPMETPPAPPMGQLPPAMGQLPPPAPMMGGPSPQQLAPPPPANGTPGPMPPQASPMPAGALPSMMPGMMPETPEQKLAKKMDRIMRAIALLRQDKLRGFRIDIETDSTVAGNAEQEKAQRVEFLTATTKFIETAAQVTAMVPEFAPLAAKMLGFGVRGFRVGRDLESAIDEFSDKAEQDTKKKALQPPKPTPEEIKAQGELQRQAVENQGEQANNQANMQIKQMEIQLKQMELEIAKIRAQAEIQKNQIDGESKAREAHMNALQHEQEMARDDMRHRQDMEMKAHDHFHKAVQIRAASKEQKKEGGEPDKVDEYIKRLDGHLERMSSPVEMEFIRGPDDRIQKVRRTTQTPTRQ